MNKDAFLATLIGLVIGLLITGIIVVGPPLVKRMSGISVPSIPKISLPNFSLPKKQTGGTPTPAENQTKEHTITISSPLPESIEQNEQIIVSGTTTPDSLVVFQGPTDDAVVHANAEGKYAGKLTLVEGKNTVTVSAYDKNNKYITTDVTVYYTPEEL